MCDGLPEEEDGEAQAVRYLRQGPQEQLLILGAPEDPQAGWNVRAGEAGQEAPLLLRELPEDIWLKECVGKSNFRIN